MQTISKLPRRALATGVAACAHLLVLLLLGWKVPRLAVPSRAEGEAPTLELFLVRPQAPPRKLSSPPEKSGPQKPRPAPAPASAAPRVLSVPAPEAPLASTPKPPPPSAEADVEGDRVRNALHGLLGCTSATARLTPEEQQACDRRLAEAKPAPVGPGYSAKEEAQFNGDRKELIFTRKPHNECLPHIGDRPAPAAAPVGSGKSTAFGLACEWSFW